MIVYRISYAEKGQTKRTQFEYQTACSLSHHDVVRVAARYKMKHDMSIPCSENSTLLLSEKLVRLNVQVMDDANIQDVEFIIEGSTYIQCIPSVWEVTKGINEIEFLKRFPRTPPSS